MGYILNDISLLTDGLVSPLELDPDPSEFCLQPFPLLTHGIIVLAELEDEKLADPYTGPSRFTEPFDLGYYRMKYGRRQSPATKERPETPEPERTNLMPQLILEDTARAELERLEARNQQTELEIRELEIYIDQVGEALVSDLQAELEAEELENERRLALIARLEENRIAAREALLLAMERQRRQRNQLAAVEAVIRTYY